MAKERVKFNFFGLGFESEGPTAMTLKILGMFLVFFAVIIIAKLVIG